MVNISKPNANFSKAAEIIRNLKSLNTAIGVFEDEYRGKINEFNLGEIEWEGKAKDSFLKKMNGADGASGMSKEIETKLADLKTKLDTLNTFISDYKEKASKYALFPGTYSETTLVTVGENEDGTPKKEEKETQLHMDVVKDLNTSSDKLVEAYNGLGK